MKSPIFSLTRSALMVSLALLLFSCVIEPEITPEPVPEPDPYAVPLDEALNGMYDLMDVLYGHETRASERRVASVETFKPQQEQTRAANLTTGAYVVNFEGGNGFAVLGATRATDPVICITENGSLSAEDLIRVERQLLAGPPEGSEIPWMSYRDIHNFGFGPAGNPEPFDITDYNIDWEAGDERFEDTGDFLVGATQDFAAQLVVSILRYPADDTWGLSGDANSSTTTTTGPWVDLESIGPLIETDWHQGAPFNNNCPVNIIAGIPIGTTRTAAGCVAIAMAQIFAYNEKPSPSFFGVTSTWAELKNHTYRADDISKQAKDIAKIIYAIGKGVSMDYGTESGTSAAAAKRYMKNKLSDYSDVKKYESYKEEVIRDMLDHRRPVFISGWHKLFAGHAWIIDGILKQRQTTTTITTTSTGRTTKETQKYRTLVHYEFGWGGNKCNGYYLFGKSHVDLQNGPVLSDPTEDIYNGKEPNELQREYNYWFRTIKYK